MMDETISCICAKAIADMFQNFVPVLQTIQSFLNIRDLGFSIRECLVLTGTR